MLNMKQDTDEPPSTNTSLENNGDVRLFSRDDIHSQNNKGFLRSLKRLFKPKHDASLRETIEDYIEDDHNGNAEHSISEQEKTLISNVLNLRELCADDVMIPRADIVAINTNITEKELLKLLADKQYSRLPVYKETLDNVIGSIHIKDILSTISQGKKVDIKNCIRDVPIISPSMHVLDLLLEMRHSRKHMALVVDEFGGIDGLITINDVIESIIGEIDDEHIVDEQPTLKTVDDGSVIADARYDIDLFEEQFGEILTEEEREDSDTLGGLIFFLAGRVPARGEVITHNTGMILEVLEADPRRVKKIRIRDIPQTT